MHGHILLCVLFLGLQTDSAKSTARDPGSAAIEYYYRFENAQMEVTRSELKFDDRGAGLFLFQTKEQAEGASVSLQLLPATMARVKRYLDALRFLDSDENYQGDRDMSHLGVSTIGLNSGTKGRQVSFNYTQNPSARELSSLLRSITYQEHRTFVINLAWKHDPLDLDRQMRALEREVKNGWLPEPQKLAPLLEGIAADPDLLLMVRRKAQTIARQIEKSR